MTGWVSPAHGRSAHRIPEVTAATDLPGVQRNLRRLNLESPVDTSGESYFDDEPQQPEIDEAVAESTRSEPDRKTMPPRGGFRGRQPCLEGGLPRGRLGVCNERA